MKKKSFTLLEVMLVTVLIAILGAVGIYYWNYFTERAVTTEARLNVETIRKAEELHNIYKGSFVPADNIQQINELLSLKIEPRYYEYRVVGVTEDNFIVIAQRIGSDILAYLDAGELPPKAIVMAMDRTGVLTSGYGQYIGSGYAGGGSGSGGSGGGTGYGGGGSGAGGTGAGGGGGEGGTGTGGGTGGGGIPSASVTPVVYSAEISATLNKIKDITATFASGDSGLYYYNLLSERNINIVYEELVSPGLGIAVLGQWSSKTNTISINQALKTTAGWPAEAIASIIIHEATHADYYYNPDKWADRILARWQTYKGEQLTKNKLIDPSTGKLYYTITEEYFTNCNEAETWRELKGNTTYNNIPGGGIEIMNGKLSRFEQGEAETRAYLRNLYELPEFYEGEPA